MNVQIHLDSYTLAHVLYFLFVWPGAYMFARVTTLRHQKLLSGVWIGYWVAMISNLGTEITQGIAPGPLNFFDPVDLLVGWIPTTIVLVVVLYAYSYKT